MNINGSDEASSSVPVEALMSVTIGGQVKGLAHSIILYWLLFLCR